jgi:hypothetical protein
MKVVSGIFLALVLCSTSAWSVDSVPFYGWQCKGEVKPGLVIYATVFYRGKIKDKDLYHLEITQVNGSEDSIFYRLARTDQAQASKSQGKILYQGSSAEALTTLSIPVSEEALNSYLGYLEISRVGGSDGARFSELPISDPQGYPLECSPVK